MTKDITHFSLSNFIEEGFWAAPQNSWPDYKGGNTDRSKFVSSSQAHNCERWIKYDKITGSPTGGKLKDYGMAERGHTAEAWMVEKIRFANKGTNRLLFMGDDQRTFFNMHQSGTPDGVAFINSTTAVVIEFKSIDPRTSISKLPKPAHNTQVIQNMDLVEFCLDVDVVGTKILYVDASNYQNRYEFFIPFEGEQHAIAAKLEAKAKRIMEADKPEDLDPVGIHTGDCTYCPFKAQCSGATMKSKQDTERNARNERLAGSVFR